MSQTINIRTFLPVSLMALGLVATGCGQKGFEPVDGLVVKPGLIRPAPKQEAVTPEAELLVAEEFEAVIDSQASKIIIPASLLDIQADIVDVNGQPKLMVLTLLKGRVLFHYASVSEVPKFGQTSVNMDTQQQTEVSQVVYDNMLLTSPRVSLATSCIDDVALSRCEKIQVLINVAESADVNKVVAAVGFHFELSGDNNTTKYILTGSKPALRQAPRGNVNETITLEYDKVSAASAESQTGDAELREAQALDTNALVQSSDSPAAAPSGAPEPAAAAGGAADQGASNFSILDIRDDEDGSPGPVAIPPTAAASDAPEPAAVAGGAPDHDASNHSILDIQDEDEDEDSPSVVASPPAAAESTSGPVDDESDIANDQDQSGQDDDSQIGDDDYRLAP